MTNNEELLLEAERLLRRLKDDTGLWDGRVGFSPSQREAINEWLRERAKAAS